VHAIKLKRKLRTMTEQICTPSPSLSLSLSFAVTPYISVGTVFVEDILKHCSMSTLQMLPDITAFAQQLRHRNLHNVVNVFPASSLDYFLAFPIHKTGPLPLVVTVLSCALLYDIVKQVIGDSTSDLPAYSLLLLLLPR